MARACGQYLPRVLRPKLVERRSDIHRRRKGSAAVATPHIKRALVFDAEEEMHHSLAAAGDHDRVVVRDHIGGTSARRRSRILRYGPPKFSYDLLRCPGRPMVVASAYDEVNAVPVRSPGFTRLGVCQQDSVRCRHNSRDAIHRVAGSPRNEEVRPHRFRRVHRRRCDQCQDQT
jgi:hypothetical protein